MPESHHNAEPVADNSCTIDITVYNTGWTRAESELSTLKRAAIKSSHYFNYNYVEEPRSDSHSLILGLPYYRIVRNYRIDTNLPTKADKYELLGTLDHMSSTTHVIVDPLPGRIIPPQLTNDDGGCDHCQKRRRRRTTFVLMSTSGEIVRVGSTCLREFIGLDGAQTFQWQVKLQDLSRIAPDTLPVDERLYKTDDVLALSVAFIRERGFVPVSNDDDNAVSTKSIVEKLLRDVTPDQWTDRDLKAIALQSSSTGFTGDHEQAQNILEKASAIRPTSHYLHQLRSATQHDIMPPQVLAILISSIAHFEQLHIKSVSTTITKRVNVGLGDIDELKAVRCTLLRVVPSIKYGSVTHVCTFRDEHGHTLKWFSSTHPHYDIGTRLLLTGSVKRHDEYQGTTSTVVDECTLTIE